MFHLYACFQFTVEYRSEESMHYSIIFSTFYLALKHSCSKVYKVTPKINGFLIIKREENVNGCPAEWIDWTPHIVPTMTNTDTQTCPAGTSSTRYTDFLCSPCGSVCVQLQHFFLTDTYWETFALILPFCQHWLKNKNPAVNLLSSLSQRNFSHQVRK